MKAEDDNLAFYNLGFFCEQGWAGLGWVGWPLEDTLPKTMSSVNLLRFPSGGRTNSPRAKCRKPAA